MFVLALALKYEINHYMENVSEANATLTELSQIIETYDLRELQRKIRHVEK